MTYSNIKTYFSSVMYTSFNRDTGTQANFHLSLFFFTLEKKRPEIPILNPWYWQPHRRFRFRSEPVVDLDLESLTEHSTVRKDSSVFAVSQYLRKDVKMDSYKEVSNVKSMCILGLLKYLFFFMVRSGSRCVYDVCTFWNLGFPTFLDARVIF